MAAMEGYITTSEAAKKIGVSPSRVRQFVADGLLPVERLGAVNMVKESDLALIQDRAKVGRPKKEEAPAVAVKPTAKKPAKKGTAK